MNCRDSEQLVSQTETDVENSCGDGNGAPESELQATLEIPDAGDSARIATPHADHAILIIEGDRFVDCNEAAVRMLGFMGRDECLLTHPAKLSPERQPDRLPSAEKAELMINTALEKGFNRFEWIHRKANGEDFPVEVSLIPIKQEGKTLIHCVWRDLTKQKAAEHELKQTLERLERLNRLQGQLILPGTTNDKLKMITDTAVDVLELDFCRLWITREDDREDAGASRDSARHASGPPSGENKCLHLVASSGRYTNLRGRFSRISLGSGHVGRLAVSSKRKRIVRNLAEEKHAADPAWVAELELTSFLGHKLCDVAGRTVGALAMFSRHPFSRNDETFAAHLAETAAKTVVDVESRRELLEAREKAEAATRAKDSFLASMSHEIRTPMTAILGFAEILERDLEGTKLFAIAETVKRNGEHLLTIINDILDIAKIEAGKTDLEITEWSPRQVFEDGVSLLQGRAAAKGLELSYEETTPLPDLIKTDPARLRQILLNLVGNAIKFTDEGTVRVVAGATGNPGAPSEVRCDVIDTGIGIPESVRAEIFEPFSQADQSSSRRFEGTGLGLAISRRLVEGLGGSLTVSSVEGKGSTFSFTVPTGLEQDVSAGRSASTGETAPPRREKRGAQHEKRGAQHEKRGAQHEKRGAQHEKRGARRRWNVRGRILLAEDVQVNQLLVTSMLREAGAEVTSVSDGREAVEHILDSMRAEREGSDEHAKPYDLILMDMQMPILDGYEAARQLRNEGFAGPIVALTAHAMRGDRQKCVEAGCDDYLSKPIDKTQLLSTVEKWLKRSDETREQANSMQGDER